MKAPKPWYRSQTKAWYIQVDGVQRPLGMHPAKEPPPRKEGGDWKPSRDIVAAWHRLMAGEGLATPARNLTLGGLNEHFLVGAANAVAPETAAWYRRFLADCEARFPRLPPAEIAPRHVRAWVAAERKKKWGQSSQRLAARHPDGPIFRNADGDPWTLQAINCRFRRTKNRKSDRLDDDVTAYVYRHSLATDALENGVPYARVAELMGHSGTAVLHKYYSKLREKREHLRRAVEQATKGRGE